MGVLPILVSIIGVQGDFLAFYTGSHVVWWGNLERLYDRALFQTAQYAWVGEFEGAYRFVYLPAFIGYYLPFAALPLLLARIIFVLTNLGLLGISIHLARAWHSLSRATAVLGVLAFAGSYAAFVVGQNSPLTLLLMTLITIWMAVHPRPGYAGIVSGFLLYKPQLLIGLVVVWVVRRAWRALTALSVMALIWLGLSWWIAPTATFQYVTLGQSLLGALDQVEANSSLYAAFILWFPHHVAIIATLVVALLTLGVLAWVWARYPTSPWHYAMMWLSTFLCTPYIANYDLLLLLLPLSFLIPLLPRYRGLQFGVAAVWIAPAITLVIAGSAAVAWTTLLLYAMCTGYVLQENTRTEGVTKAT